MTTADFYVLAAPLQSDWELAKERPQVSRKQLSFTRRKVEAEPETRLWKICAEVAPPRLSRFEWIAILAFSASAFVAVACCAFEWFHLFSSEALEHTVRALLTKAFADISG